MKKLFRARAIVTSNSSSDVFEDGFLAIENDRILDVGPWKKRPRTFSRSTEVDVTHAMITPGLFNLHTHLPMTLLRGVAEDVDLQTWIFKYILPIEQKWVTPDFVRIGTELALCESLRGGVTFVAEMYYYDDVIADVTAKFGVRALLGETVLGMKSPDADTTDQAFDRIRKMAKKFKGHPRVMAGIAPHAPYTVSPDELRQSAALARELDIPLMIHLLETKRELIEVKEKYGKSPVKILNETGILNAKRVLLAHSVWVQDEDLPLLRGRENVSVVLNAQCNAKLDSGFPPVHKYIENGIRFCIGTDGAASNNNLDIFEEMNFFSKIHHLQLHDLTGLPGPLLFSAATRKAAEAVGLGSETGSLEPGKSADFILIDLRSPHLTPLIKPYSHLIYSVRGPDVESVYIAGKPLMKNRKILVADEAKIRARAEKLWAKIAKTMKAQPR